MDKSVFVQAEKRRQQILDFGHGRGEFTSLEVSEALGITRDHAQRLCGALVDMGEAVKIKRGRKVLFVAVAKTTERADSVFERACNRQRDRQSEAFAALRAERAMREAAKNKREPWRTVHVVGEHDKPIPNQGGQGAARPRGMSTLEYV